jgi:hypothetical protein
MSYRLPERDEWLQAIGIELGMTGIGMGVGFIGLMPILGMIIEKINLELVNVHADQLLIGTIPVGALIGFCIGTGIILKELRGNDDNK